jgi:hypothetical protein
MDGTKKYQVGDHIWFRRDKDESFLAGVVLEADYLVSAVPTEARTKRCFDGEFIMGDKFPLSLTNPIRFVSNKYEPIDCSVTLDIEAISNCEREIFDSFDGKKWEWDNTKVPGRVVSCTPIYMVLGQYQGDAPSIENVDAKLEGEMYRLDEECLTRRIT